MGNLDGKVAIVTGAGRGIGRGEALLLAEEGASVVVNDVDIDVAQAVVDEIATAGGKGAANNSNVASWDGAQQLVRQAVDTFGDLDILVNNAGILRDKMSFNMEEAEWDAVIDVHLKGHFAPSRFAASYWRDQAKAGKDVSGRIINTSSEAGLFGNAGQANYSAAKLGIVALTWVFARELERYGVTVNAIAPRARTRMTEDLGVFAAPGEGFDAGAPENIAPAVAWLATDAAADISGQVFIVAGGQVHLVEPFRVTNSVRKDERWTVSELIKEQDALFGDRKRGVPAFALAQ